MQPIAAQNYMRIQEAANAEIKRIKSRPDDCRQTSRGKARAISEALDRLYLVVVKNTPNHGIPHRLIILSIKEDEISKIDLSTIRSMLDARISQWEDAIAPWTEHGDEYNGRTAGYRIQASVREALNVSTNNLFNDGISTWGPLWGKTEALKNVEAKLTLE